MEIVSGLGEKPHVTSQQFRQILEGTIGQESYIVTSGENWNRSWLPAICLRFEAE